jgi:hypothetical protein
MAPSQEYAHAIVQDCLQATDLYADQVSIKGIEFDMSEDEYADAMPYDHFNE